MTADKTPPRYFIGRDSCAWYLIREADRDRWESWLRRPGMVTPDFLRRRIDPCGITFTDPRDWPTGNTP